MGFVSNTRVPHKNSSRIAGASDKKDAAFGAANVRAVSTAKSGRKKRGRGGDRSSAASALLPLLGRRKGWKWERGAPAEEARE